MTLATIQREVMELRDGMIDSDLKAALDVAAERLVPGVRRVTLEWITLMLRAEGRRQASYRGRDVLSGRLTGMSLAVQDLWTD